ncbi:MAG: hypothetical protein MHPSP_003879 [Paramarteilia canceri]
MNLQAHKSGNRSDRSQDLENLFNQADSVVILKKENENFKEELEKSKTELEESNKKLENLEKYCCTEIDHKMNSFGKKDSRNEFANDFIKQLVEATNFDDVLTACFLVIDLMFDQESVESENFKEMFEMICSIFKKFTQGSFFSIYSIEDNEKENENLVVLSTITNIFQCFIGDHIAGIKLAYQNIKTFNRKFETLDTNKLAKLEKLYNLFLEILEKKTYGIKSDSEDSSNATTHI